MTTEPQASSRKPEYLGEPTLAQVMRRPRWILALLLAMLVAAVFAWLGRWQMDSAIRTDAADAPDTEQIRPLSEAAEPATSVTEDDAGSVVSVSGAFVVGDTRIVSPRENGGESGAWVVGHLRAADDAESGAGLAVAIGWAPSVAAAERGLEALEADPEFTGERDFEGRLMPAEGPEVPDPDEDPQTLKTMAPAQLVNVWKQTGDPAYTGYLVMHQEAGGPELLDIGSLDPVDSVAPEPPEKVNWLNVFYALEWVVFAGFAVFLWYRLARDAWEKEHEMQLLEAEGSATSEDDTETANRVGGTE